MRETGFDPDLPSRFIWEGNTMCPPRDLIFGFLDRLADGLPAFSIALDYMSRQVIEGNSGIDSVTTAFDYFYEQFTPFITGLDDAIEFEQNTRLKVIEPGGMDELGVRHAPQFGKSLAHFKGLYNYCILAN